ncbi:MAG TPA: hypothetical protein VGM18_11615, partial [Candidatus Sulfotelmatobacter sp.]
ARMRRVLEVEMPVRSVFDAPTIAALAREVEKVRSLGLKAHTPILRRPDRAAAKEREVLEQLDTLPAEEAKRLVKTFLHGKQTGTVQSRREP